MSRHEVLQRKILEYIEKRALAPGERLPPERRLAELLESSRNSVREAIRALAQQGRLQSRPGDGTYVLEPAGQDADWLQLRAAARRRRLQEIFALRRILEPGVAAMAAENATAADITRLKALVFDQQRAQQQGQDDSDLDAAFHQQLARATRNQVLCDVMQTLQGVLAESRAGELQPPRRRQLSPQAHYAVIEALEAGDAAGAQEAMRRHLEEVETLAFDSKGTTSGTETEAERKK